MTQVMTQEELEMISELCRKHDVIVVSDEVYEWLVYPPNKHIRIGQCAFSSSVCTRLNKLISSDLIGSEIK